MKLLLTIISTVYVIQAIFFPFATRQPLKQERKRRYSRVKKMYFKPGTKRPQSRSSYYSERSEE